MKGKHIIVSSLVVALVAVVAAPPAQADFLVLSVVLAATFLCTAFVVENARNDENEATAEQNEENVIFTNDAKLVNEFGAHFDRLWAKLS